MTATRSRRAVAAFVTLHGLAHLASTGDLLTRVAEHRSAEFLGGTWTVSDPAALRLLAVAAALLAAAYVGAAVAIWAARPAWPRLLMAVTLVSVGVVVFSLWASVVGLLVNAVLIALATRPRLVDPSWSAAGARDRARRVDPSPEA